MEPIDTSDNISADTRITDKDLRAILPASQSLVGMDKTGTVLWRLGESGEGPGYFAAIGQVDVMGDTIELLNGDGSMICRLSAMERPMDISFADNTDTGVVHYIFVPLGERQHACGKVFTSQNLQGQMRLPVCKILRKQASA